MSFEVPDLSARPRHTTRIWLIENVVVDHWVRTGDGLTIQQIAGLLGRPESWVQQVFDRENGKMPRLFCIHHIYKPTTDALRELLLTRRANGERLELRRGA